MTIKNPNWIRWALTLSGICTGLSLMGIPTFSAEPPQRFEFTQIRMGIPVRIVVYADDSASAIQATDAAYERIRQLDRTLSDYDPDSELQQIIANYTPGNPVPISEDFLNVLKESKSLSAKTEGAFDVSVGPVIQLWRAARRNKKLPDPQRVQTALKSVGDQFITVNSDSREITLARANMQLDFGGIAKGYAADEALIVLKQHGISQALIAVAGDIRVGDAPPGQTGWKIEIEDRTRPPSEESPPLVAILANQAVSTSGDTYQYLEIDGVRYSHIVDPKSGLGMTTPGSSTVIAPNAMLADGLASSLVLLGPEKGIELLKQFPGTSAIIFRLEENGERTVNTSSNWPFQSDGCDQIN
ncbi:FAD:protein FMN transferase [Planctomicrobium sp. SH668]|uniref:FAD:protein FMN transferase n=1 Tax=Planctomicrobium sp. SH668 TaxID=3448126 RepID=UPI003F5C20CD